MKPSGLKMIIQMKGVVERLKESDVDTSTEKGYKLFINKWVLFEILERFKIYVNVRFWPVEMIPMHKLYIENFRNIFFLNHGKSLCCN